MFRIALCVLLCKFLLLKAAPALNQEDKSIYDRIERINEDNAQKMFEGDILESPFVDEATSGRLIDSKRDATRYQHYLWRTRVIPYTIASEFTSFEKEQILNALKTFEQHTCLKFKNHIDEDQWINFRQLHGCYSYVGRAYWTTGPQTISLGVGCLQQSTILHEIMHALGFWHEQSRPDRDKYVEIFWENIKDDQIHNFNKYSHQSADILGTQYDFDTIMHYGKYAFSKNGQVTIKAIGSDKNLGEAATLGTSDITALNALYDCSSQGVSIWSTWSSYGPCDNSCHKTRQRFCSDPNLSNCIGANEHGIIAEQAKCTDVECYAPVDGHWNRWSSWGACSTECGPGRRSRTRECNNPEPRHGGAACKGELVSYTDCLMQNCGLGPLDCEFDGQGWCFWQNSATNPSRFKWERKTGTTSTIGTGPSNDHTSGSGYYLYVETSSPAEVGDKARLVSQAMPATDGLCMSFWYHMYGMTMGTLRVFKRTNGVESLLWEKSGDQGDQWLEGKLKITNAAQFEVIIEAEKGGSFWSDIGIDDVKLKDCAPKSILEQKCGIKMKALGCYNEVSSPKVFPEMLDNHRDAVNGHVGYMIDWNNYPQSLESIMCHCASKAKAKGYTYFSLSFYAECWAGPGDVHYNKYGSSSRCINSQYKQCALADDAMCCGSDDSSFVYQIL